MRYLKVTGWGPFRLPGEKRRAERAYQEAVELMNNLRATGERTVDFGNTTFYLNAPVPKITNCIPDPPPRSYSDEQLYPELEEDDDVSS